VATTRVEEYKLNTPRGFRLHPNDCGMEGQRNCYRTVKMPNSVMN
jgi:hypothetical protein